MVRFQLSKRILIYIAFVVIIILTGFWTHSYLKQHIEMGNEKFLVARTTQIVTALDLVKVQEIAARFPKVVKDAVFSNIKNQLVRTRQSLSDIRAIYLFTKRNEQFSLLADSELDEVKDIQFSEDKFQQAMRTIGFFQSDKTQFVSQSYRDSWGEWLDVVTMIGNSTETPLYLAVEYDFDSIRRVFRFVDIAVMVAFVLIFINIILGFYRYDRLKKINGQLKESESTSQKIQSSLKESEQSYRDLFEQNDMVMLMVDPITLQIVNANLSACKFLGYSKEQIINSRVVDLNIGSEEELRNQIGQILTGQKRAFERKYRVSSGDVRDVLIVSSPLTIYGKLILYSIVHDTTEQKRLEKINIEHREIIDALWAAIPIPVFMRDEQGRFLFCNEAYERFCDRTWEQIVGKTPNEVYTDNTSAALKLADIELRNAKDMVQARELDVECKNGKKATVIMHRTLFQSGEGLSVVGTFMDITEIRRIEKENLKLQTQLAKSVRLTSLATFGSGLAHEINNPLAIIKGLIEIQKRRVSRNEIDPNVFTESSEKVLKQVERISVIVQRMLTFGRNFSGALQHCDLNEVVQSSFVLYVDSLKERAIKFDLELSDRPLLVQISPERVETAIHSIVKNSEDALIDTAIEERRICICTRDLANEAILEIIDNGCGIPPENLERVFDPFFTTKPAGQGIGMGLSLVYNFIHQLSGKIEIESEVGVGTKVRIKFPKKSSNS